MTGRRGSDRSQQGVVTRLAELSVVISTGVALISIFGNNDRFILAIGLPVLLFIAAGYFLARRLYSVITTTVTIAVGGLPDAGKTVYINVLCNRLTEGTASFLSFTPETQTAQRVFRTVGNIRKGRWPATTGSDRIDYYRGTVGYLNRSLLRILANGRQEFKVEFGDSAGENWERLASEAENKVEVRAAEGAASASDEPPVSRLVESNFFTYVGESDSLFYLIDISNLQSVLESTDDLLSTVTLLRATEGRRPGSRLEKPISVIFSKIDLLGKEERLGLERLFSSDFEYRADRKDGSGDLPAKLTSIAALKNFLDKQVASSAFFMVSALGEIESSRRPIEGITSRGRPDRRPLVDSTEGPLDWTFYVLRRFRLFRGRTTATW